MTEATLENLRIPLAGTWPDAVRRMSDPKPHLTWLGAENVVNRSAYPGWMRRVFAQDEIRALVDEVADKPISVEVQDDALVSTAKAPVDGAAIEESGRALRALAQALPPMMERLVMAELKHEPAPVPERQPLPSFLVKEISDPDRGALFPSGAFSENNRPPPPEPLPVEEQRAALAQLAGPSPFPLFKIAGGMLAGAVVLWLLGWPVYSLLLAVATVGWVWAGSDNSATCPRCCGKLFGFGQRPPARPSQIQCPTCGLTP